jgi:hypothetical protein
MLMVSSASSVCFYMTCIGYDAASRNFPARSEVDKTFSRTVLSFATQFPEGFQQGLRLQACALQMRELCLPVITFAHVPEIALAFDPMGAHR